MTQDLFDSFVVFVFDRALVKPETKKSRSYIGEEWYWYEDQGLDDIGITALDQLKCCVTLFENCGTTLDTYSDDQVGIGIDYLLMGNGSDIVHLMNDVTLPENLRLRFLKGIGNLYRDVFAKRCLSANGKDGSNKIDYVQFMIWDSFMPQTSAFSNQNKLKSVVIDSLSMALQTKHLGCMYAGLHGFNHMIKIVGSDNSVGIIDNFLIENIGLPNDLVEYANEAKFGWVL